MFNNSTLGIVVFCLFIIMSLEVYVCYFHVTFFLHLCYIYESEVPYYFKHEITQATEITLAEELFPETEVLGMKSIWQPN